MSQVEYWNRFPPEKKFTTPFNSDVFEKYVSFDKLIVDIGCGYARTLGELHSLGYRKLIGIDLSENMIERGKRSFPFLDLRIASTSVLEDNSIDAVILFGVLTCTQDNSQQELLVSEILRILVPGGIVYINDFLINKDIKSVIKYCRGKKSFKNYGTFQTTDGGILRHHTQKYISRLLSPFEKLEYQRQTFKTINGNLSNAFYFIGRKPQ